MSDLTNIEKRSLERLFGMGSGYVLDFSNRTFEEFVLDSTGKTIYAGEYESAGGSKANRLRAFWGIESNHIVGKLLGDLLEYASERQISSDEKPLLESCRRTVQRLSVNQPVPEIDAIALFGRSAVPKERTHSWCICLLTRDCVREPHEKD